MRIYTDRFHVGAPTHVGPLSFFPVWSETRSTFQHVAGPFPEVGVSEFEVPQVSGLTLLNRTRGNVLIPEGTVLAGGNQTRVLHHDVLLGAGQGSDVEVRCVEQGRWGDRVEAGVAGRVPAAVVGALRGISRDGERRPGDQGEVWRRVGRYEQVYGERRTSSLQSLMMLDATDQLEEPDAQRRGRIRQRQAMARAVSAKVTELARHPLPGQNGLVVGVSGQPVLLEIFSDEAAFRAQVAAIMQAAAIDAPRASGEPTPARRAVRMAESIMDTALVHDPFDELRIVGIGERVDIRSLLAPGGQGLHTAVLNTRHQLVVAG